MRFDANSQPKKADPPKQPAGNQLPPPPVQTVATQVQQQQPDPQAPPPQQRSAWQSAAAAYQQPQQPTTPPPVFTTTPPKSNTMSQDQTVTQKPSLIRGGMRSPIGRNNSSAAIDSIRKAIDELGVGNEWNNYDLRFIEMDTSGAQRRVAAFVMAIRCKSEPTSPIAYHAMLLEETGEMQVVKRRYDNVNYEDLLYPSDGYDGQMRQDVITRVAAAFMPGHTPVFNKETGTHTVNGVILMDCMSSTIPSTVNLKELSQVRGPLANAAIAVFHLLNQHLGRSDDLKLEGNVAGQRWTANVLTSTASFTDMTGTPNRGSVVVEVKEGGNDHSSNTNYNATYNDAHGEQLTHQILGFMDCVYDPSPAAQMMSQSQNPFMGFGGQFGQMSADSCQVMRGRYVITHLDAIFNPSLPDILFGLACANEAVLENRGWMHAFVAQHNNGADDLVNGYNLRDLGILGTEVTRMGAGEHQGQMVKTRFSTSGGRGEDAVLFQILNLCFRPEPILSIHVPESGAFSWMSGYFVSAAMGSKQAEAEIIAAANYMTRDQFGIAWNNLTQGMQARVVINDNQFVNLGRYTDHNSMLRDSREVSTIEVMNVFGEKNPDMVSRWLRMQNDTSLPMDFRLTETREIIKAMYTNVQFTGRARSITFDPLFMRALSQGIAACGGRINLRKGNENPQSTERVTAQFLNGTRFATGNSGFYTAQQFQQPHINQNGLGNWGRWQFPGQ